MLEQPDLIFLRMRGDVNEEHAVGLYEVVTGFSKGRSYILLLCDLTQLGSISPEARTTLAQLSRDGIPRGTAVFGAAFRTRVVVDMVARASNLFTQRRRQLRFVDTEAQARACVEQMRQHFTKV